MLHQLFDYMRELNNTPAAQVPAIQFVVAMRKELVRLGFSADAAEKIATSMDVVLPPGSLSPEQVDEVAGVFAAYSSRVLNEFSAQGFVDPEQAVANMAQHIELKMH